MQKLHPIASITTVEERDSLRHTIKVLEREIRHKDKQLREFCDAATDLHHNIEEQEEMINTQLLRQRDSTRTTGHHHPSGQPLRRASSVNSATSSPHANSIQPQHPFEERSESPCPPDAAKDWKSLYIDSEKRCEMLQHALERMRDEVFLHRSRACRMLESLSKSNKDNIAQAETRAENAVDRKLHSMSRLRSASMSSTSSISECESTTPRDRSDTMSAALRAHTRTLLASSVPLANSPSHNNSSSTFLGGADTLSQTHSTCGITATMPPLFNTLLREEGCDELRGLDNTF